MKDPAFLFYPADFLVGCSDLTMIERGQYITLLCLQHQKGHLSKKIVGLSLGIEWVSLSEELRRKFKEDEAGLIYNGRLDREMLQRTQFVEKQRNNGKSGGRPKKAETRTKPKQNPNRTQTEPSRDENIIEDDNKVNNEDKRVQGENEDTYEVLDEFSFENVWTMYGRKGNKKTSNRRWDALTNKAKQLAITHIPRYVDSTPNIQYRKNFETYINQEAWNDEILLISDEKSRITITEDGRTMEFGNTENGGNTFRTDAEKRRYEREMLKQVSEAILQQPKT
jgi:hypothetical protein